jgi:Cu/Ag efflux protein CusF
MKNAIKVLVVVLTVLGFSGMSFAQAKPAEPAKAEKPKISRITGEVTSVDAKDGMLTVKAKDKEVSLTAEPKVKTALEKIKVGDTVNVSYTEKDGKMVATAVKAEVKKEKAPKKAK